MTEDELDNISAVIQILIEDNESWEKSFNKTDKSLDYALNAICIEFEDNPRPFPALDSETRYILRALVDKWYLRCSYVKKKEVCH